MPAGLILGSTGLLGQAIRAEAANRTIEIVGAARHGADYELDLYDRDAIGHLFSVVKPGFVINAAANTQIDQCEIDPGGSYAINARAVALVADQCKRVGAYLVHISTDHFFEGDGRRQHDEKHAVVTLNEYARTKLAGELFAGLYDDSLIVRTNITGFRHWPDRPTFAEWVFERIASHGEISLFHDFFTSTIDVGSAAKAIFDMMERRVHGLYNVASSDVASKSEFVEMLASKLGVVMDWASSSSVKTLRPRRADSLGLDVRKAESVLGYALPDLERVCLSLVLEYESRQR